MGWTQWLAAQSLETRHIVHQQEVSSLPEQGPVMLQPGRLTVDIDFKIVLKLYRCSLGQDADEGSLRKSVMKWRRWHNLPQCWFSTMAVRQDTGTGL